MNTEIKSYLHKVSLGRSSACQMVSMKPQIKMHDETSWYVPFASLPSNSTDDGETVGNRPVWKFRTTVQSVQNLWKVFDS